MKAQFAAIAILAVFLAVFGCVLPWEHPPETPTPTPTPIAETPTPVNTTCPETCSDENPCTVDLCSPLTDFRCQHEYLFGPQPGCMGDAGGCMEYTCSRGVCVKTAVVPCCGNHICESNENCENCSQDCACLAGDLCCNTTCKAIACTNDTQCKSAAPDVCLTYYCANPGTCSAACSTVGKACGSGDDCCPPGCDYLTDNDCPAYSKGNPMMTKNNVSILVQSLSNRRCFLGSGREQQWYAIRMVVKYQYPEGTQTISPEQFQLVDLELGLDMAPSTPVGDCYESDSPLLLMENTTLSYSMGEMTRFVYFYPNGRNIISGSKRFIFTEEPGSRYIWLLSPQ